MARAITAPSAILVAGAGTALAVVAGFPAAGAAAAGALAYAARVAVAVPRRRRRERIDPARLGEPWRHFVREALQARARYDRAVQGMDPGPLRDRLAEIGERIATGVQECWYVARRGEELQAALADLDVANTRRELEAVERALQRAPSERSLERTAESLRAQLSSVERLADVAAGARDRLRLLDARLDEAVARAVELSLRSGSDTDAAGLGSDVDQLVDEMEALRTALDDTA